MTHDAPTGLLFVYWQRDDGVLEPLVSVQDACRIADLSRSRIAQLMSVGMLHRYPVDDRTYFLSKRELLAYVASNRKPGPKKRRA